MEEPLKRKELRHDRHTVSLLTDHLAFSPKYMGKVLIGDVHIFFKYPPKYSLSYIAKKLKGRTSRVLREEFPHLREWCGEHLWAPSCFHGSVGQGWEVVERYVETQDLHHAKPIATGFVH